jgi:hypothetical protein
MLRCTINQAKFVHRSSSANYQIFLTFWIIPARPHCAPTALVVTPDLGADVHCTRVRPRPWRADAQYEGRWASWVLVLSRAAFVLSRATRSAISSMRASSCSNDEFELLVLFRAGFAWEVRYNIDVR